MESPRLIVVSGLIPGQEYPLLGEVTTIGRESDNILAFHTELKVSAHHARILKRIGLFWLEDMKSTNGTYLTPPGGERFRLKPGEPVLLVEGALIHLADAVTLQAHGLIASQDEATRRALAQVQAFVGACYEQMAKLSAQERQEVQERLRQLEEEVRRAESEADLVRVVAERLTDLKRTIACAFQEDGLPSIPDDVPAPDSPLRLPSLHNLFLSHLQQFTRRDEEKKR